MCRIGTRVLSASGTWRARDEGQRDGKIERDNIEVYYKLKRDKENGSSESKIEWIKREREGGLFPSSDCRYWNILAPEPHCGDAASLLPRYAERGLILVQFLSLPLTFWIYSCIFFFSCFILCYSPRCELSHSNLSRSLLYLPRPVRVR